MDVQSVIDQLKARKPQAIILFGSHAWGKPTDDSDVDVLLVENTKKPFLDRMTDVYMKLHGPIPVDVIVLRPDEIKTYRRDSMFFNDIFENGKLVYGRI